MIDPGPRRRGQALAEEGRAAVSIAIGLVAVLLVSGLIEGFVTGWVHTTWLRITIGVVAEAAFLTYVIVLGRRAVRARRDRRRRPPPRPAAGDGMRCWRPRRATGARRPLGPGRRLPGRGLFLPVGRPPPLRRGRVVPP
nr:stage II sporulation protein M [Actinomadura madurae]